MYFTVSFVLGGSCFDCVVRRPSIIDERDLQCIFITRKAETEAVEAARHDEQEHDVAR